MKLYCLCGLLFLSACSNAPSPTGSATLKGEYIIRCHDELLLKVESGHAMKKKQYPWEEAHTSDYPKITKDFFRCQGSNLNPVHLVQKNKEVIRYYDCGGSQKHSLPLREQREFIYPILIDLLNFIQEKTGKRVVITCGHCCQEHNSYLNPEADNRFSKHMLGAEVDFYVQGMEEHPEQVIELLLSYYHLESKYKDLPEFVDFKRYEKKIKDVQTPAWYNKEIFVKLILSNEARDLDNRHPYPYICVQVRYDWDIREKVSYSWDKVFRNFHRW